MAVLGFLGATTAGAAATGHSMVRDSGEAIVFLVVGVLLGLFVGHVVIRKLGTDGRE